jgi:hypothetical protein
MEALQIAFFAVKHVPTAQVQANARASRNLDIIFRQDKLQAFLVGRQIAQTVIMFLIARIITVEMKEGASNLFGVSDGVQAVFNSGVLNALVSTIFASLSWRVTANTFPMLFLSNPVSIWIIRLCLVVEGTGICDAAWIFAKIHLYVVRYQSDDEYLGKAEEGTEDIKAGDLEFGEAGSSTSRERASEDATSQDSNSAEERQLGGVLPTYQI